MTLRQGRETEMSSQEFAYTTCSAEGCTERQYLPVGQSFTCWTCRAKDEPAPPPLAQGPAATALRFDHLETIADAPKRGAVVRNNGQYYVVTSTKTWTVRSAGFSSPHAICKVRPATEAEKATEQARVAAIEAARDARVRRDYQSM